MLLPSCFTSGDSPTTLTPSDFLFLISLRSREGVSGARIISVTKNKSIRIWISCLKLPGALLGVLNSSKGSKDVFNLRGVTDPLAGDLLRVF